MKFNYDDMDVTDIEYARYIILNSLRNTDNLIKAEKEKNGVRTIEYKRLCKEYEAIKYIESLLVNQLRILLH